MCQWFDPVDIISVVRHNKTLKRNHFHTAAIEGNYYLRGFNYLFVMRKPPLGGPSGTRYHHERAGWLSPLFDVARTQSRGAVITPEDFSRMLEDDPQQLEAGLSKKKQKKLRDRPSRSEGPRENREPRKGGEPRRAPGVGKGPNGPRPHKKENRQHGSRRPQKSGA